MILDIIYNLLYGLITIINYLPDWTIPTETTNAVTVLFDYALSFDGLFPVRTLIYILWYIVLFEFMIWFSRVALSFFNWVRGAGKLEF